MIYFPVKRLSFIKRIYSNFKFYIFLYLILAFVIMPYVLDHWVISMTLIIVGTFFSMEAFDINTFLLSEFEILETEKKIRFKVQKYNRFYKEYEYSFSHCNLEYEKKGGSYRTFNTLIIKVKYDEVFQQPATGGWDENTLKEIYLNFKQHKELKAS